MRIKNHKIYSKKLKTSLPLELATKIKPKRDLWSVRLTLLGNRTLQVVGGSDRVIKESTRTNKITKTGQCANHALDNTGLKKSEKLADE